ncbi:hypothetical protein, partial [Klebsiella pneumoniae]|uniref:hypothetical protein n=1 Tax=Klebsiella pneumoniae TaxID=573 RepID=UPI0030131DF3
RKWGVHKKNNYHRMKKLIAFAILASFISSCKKDIPPKRSALTGSISTTKKLLICNEGNFGSGNATISLYDPSSGSTVYDAYAP